MVERLIQIGHGLIFSLKKRMARTPTDFAVELLIFAQIILAVCNTIYSFWVFLALTIFPLEELASYRSQAPAM